MKKWNSEMVNSILRNENYTGTLFQGKKRKLNYRIHNPNTAAATADYILKILIDANSEKVEKAIQAAADQVAKETKCDEGKINM